MALPGSGSISLSQVQTEFGGANPISLSEYYKNGSYVTSSANAPNVPTTGAISLDNFHGASAYVTPTVSVPASVYGSCTNSLANCTAYSAYATASVSGGIGPFTYSWQYVSGTAMTVSAATSATTRWSKSCPPSTPYTAYYRCQVTDTGISPNVVVYSANVLVDVENLG